MLELVERLKQSTHLLLFLDYDGTLVPFADRPEDAKPDAELLRLLSRLARRPATEVQFVSGRDHETLEKWLGHLPVAMHAEHGFWSKGGPEATWQAAMGLSTDWKALVRRELTVMTDWFPESNIEEKSSGLVWHYRQVHVDAATVTTGVDELIVKLEHLSTTYPIEILQGNCVVEVHTRGVNKGAIIRQRIAQLTEPWLPVAIGDDRTDESMFAALPPQGVSIHVGPTPTKARFQLESPAEVRRLLTALL